MDGQKELINKITRISQYHCINSCQITIDDTDATNELCLIFEIKPNYYREIQRMIDDEDSGVFEVLLQQLKVTQTTFEIRMNYILSYPNIDISTKIEGVFMTTCPKQHIGRWLNTMHENIKMIDKEVDFYIRNY
ncbi:MAG: hypothetical protein ACM3ZC_07790 [Bacteroidota bacterium]